MTNEVLATLQIARLEFQALLSRPARLVDPADEAAVQAEAFPAFEACGCAAGACDCAAIEATAQPLTGPTLQAEAGSWTGVLGSPIPASWTAASAAVQLPAGKPSRRKRTIAARRQPLAPVAPITAQDGF